MVISILKEDLEIMIPTLLAEHLQTFDLNTVISQQRTKSKGIVPYRLKKRKFER